MTYPFQIETTFNDQMRCHEVLLQVGGIKDKAELEAFAEALAKFMAGQDGGFKRVAFDS